MAPPTELECLSTEDLIAELRRRMDAGLLITLQDKTTANDDQAALFEHGGGRYLVLGLVESVRHKLHAMMDDADEEN